MRRIGVDCGEGHSDGPHGDDHIDRALHNLLVIDGFDDLTPRRRRQALW